MSQTAEEIRQRLRTWRNDADQLLALFNDDQVVAKAKRSNAETRLRKLKDELQAEHARLRSQNGLLSSAEQDFYLPAVNEAYVKGLSSVQADSIPDSDWYEAVEEVSFTMTYYQKRVRD